MRYINLLNLLLNFKPDDLDSKGQESASQDLSSVGSASTQSLLSFELDMYICCRKSAGKQPFKPFCVCLFDALLVLVPYGKLSPVLPNSESTHLDPVD